MQSAVLIGSAGSGKTSRLMDALEGVIRSGVDPRDVGYTSFTRAAVRVAADRAAIVSGVSPAELVDRGWFRTLHSVAYHCIRRGGENVVGDPEGGDRRAKQTREWFEENMSGLSEMDATCRSWWGRARSRLVPVGDVWSDVYAESARLMDFTGSLPSEDYYLKWVREYEQAKRLTDALDFEDMCLRFVGVSYDGDGLPCEATPAEPPAVEVWFFDERQDCSPLLHRVCERLSSSARWCYSAGDPWQSIYGFMGAEPSLFLRVAESADKTETMPRSWRCPRRIHSVGEAVLSASPTYFDRKCEPRDVEGVVETFPLQEGDLRAALECVRPEEDWLVLASTEASCLKMGRELDALERPWLWTDARRSKWDAPVKLRVARALVVWQSGGAVFADDLAAVLSSTEIPVKHPEYGDLLQHGVRSKAAEKAAELRSRGDPPVTLQEQPGAVAAASYGLTDAFVELIFTGDWRTLDDDLSRLGDAYSRFGLQPDSFRLATGIRIGTIHSAKGDEADNVFLLNSMTWAAGRMIDDPEIAEEQRRLWYVGATRARERLVSPSVLESGLRRGMGGAFSEMDEAVRRFAT